MSGTQLARHMRRSPTETEQRLWAVLRNRQLQKYKFRRQHPVGCYIGDFACVTHRLIIEADGRVMVDRFEAMVGPVLSEEEREEVDTLGGLVFFVAGRVPARGELITHPAGFEFEIIEADPRRVKRMRVRRLSVAEPES